MIKKKIYDINHLMKLTGAKNYNELKIKGYIVDEYLVDIYRRLNDKINELKKVDTQLDNELKEIYKCYFVMNFDKKNDEANFRESDDNDIFRTKIVNLKPIYDLKMLIDEIQNKNNNKVSNIDLIEMHYDVIGYFENIKKKIKEDLDNLILNLNEIKQKLTECGINPNDSKFSKFETEPYDPNSLLF